MTQEMTHEMTQEMTQEMTRNDTIISSPLRVALHQQLVSLRR